MAGISHPTGNPPGLAYPGDNPAHARPPPSTLAAQLVESISASTKSSKSDENSELKGLFAVIQRVKDNPDLLKTADERIEHNHMLIYVYSRVVLEGIKFDDPFLDQAHVRTEALKAINFLRFAVKETPRVLNYRTSGDDFLFRGPEALWVWLFPQLLRLLGHPQCIELSKDIEDLLQYFLLVVAKQGALWDLAPAMMLYLRTTLTEILRRLQKNTTSTQADPFIRLNLPPKMTVETLLGRQRTATPRISYQIDRISHAIRQARSLANIITYTVISSDLALQNVASYTEISFWLIDTLLDIRVAQQRWLRLSSPSPIPIITMVLELIQGFERKRDTVFVLGKKVISLLIILCGEIGSSSDGLASLHIAPQEDRKTYCMALLKITQASIQDSSISRLAASKFINELALQCPSIPEETDLWRIVQTLKQVVVSPQQLLDERTHPAKFDDETVRRGVTALALKYEGSPEADEGRAKRRKISTQEPDAKTDILGLIYDTLNIPRPVDEGHAISEDVDVFMEAYELVDESRQCLAIDLLSKTCCMANTIAATPRLTLSTGDLRCHICDAESNAIQSSSTTVIRSEGEVYLIFTRLIQASSLLQSRRPRVAALIALRRLILHCTDPKILSIDTSFFGQWCLQSLNSSIREVRISAGRTLTTFLLERPDSQVSQGLIYRNRKNSIALLRSISEKNQIHLVETCIMAWGQLGRVVTEDELNLVLIKLLEYLGNSNNIVSAFAFNELLALAEARNVTPRHLFVPYWQNLAYMVTKDMVHRPQMSRGIAELLQISVNELLLLIQTHALPWLVLDKQTDVIQKIAEARQDKEVWQAVMESSNMAAIVAHLLVQDTEDPKSFTESRLIDIHPHFQQVPLIEIFQSEPLPIAMELLKAAGDADETQRPAVRKALHTMASMILATSKETKQKKGNVVGRFLQSHLLGLMARLTDVINDSLSNSSAVQEQRRCIRAMEEMIQVCKSYARLARPQISACLLSTLSHKGLCEASISCWAAMLTHFEEEDVESLLETTFFIVKRYWGDLTESASSIAEQMLGFVINRYEHIITKYICKLPSLHHIPELAQFESKLQSLRPILLSEDALEVFSQRIRHENSGVVLQALEELVLFLQDNQTALHTSAVSEQPDIVITDLMRALLDCACKYSNVQIDISRLCAHSMGLIGCLDSNRIETVREQRSIVVLSNFQKAEEAVDFALFLIEMVLVPSFLSATDVKLQGFLAFAIQELLDKTDVRAANANQASGVLSGNDIYRKWVAIPETVREVVQPFMSSRYMVAPMATVPVEYPIFCPGRPYGNWLRPFVVELLHKGQTGPAMLIFEPLKRVIRVKDLSTAEFLLPYLVLHVLIGEESSSSDRENVLGELIGILRHQTAEHASYQEKEDMKRYCHTVFRVIDYAMRWIQAKRSKGGLTENDKRNLSRIQEILDTIPAELISQRAIDCNEYSRALFHLEQHAQKMEQRKREPGERTRLLERLQDIYANIDEPDGLDGISSHLQVLDINQQILSHRKAGRWTAVQSWYELQLTEKPDNLDVQLDLLHCLKQAGQHDLLLNQVEGMQSDASADNKIMPFAVEAAWVTGRWESLAKFKDRFHGDVLQDFNVSLATIFTYMNEKRNSRELSQIINDMRQKVSSSMNTSATASLQACHELLLKCHVLADLEVIIRAQEGDESQHRRTMALLDRRLEIIGAYSNDKQYVLGIRKAAMELKRPTFSNFDISGVWLSTAKLARKSNSLHQSFNAVLHASQLGDDAATIENAKLLWIDNHHRKAIQMLQGAIRRNKFMTQTGTSTNTGASKMNSHQRLLTARAQLLLAKWLDNAGQTHAGALREKYQQPPKTFSTWEKGHYYLGRHYKKILESEKPLKVDDQSDNYVTGEIARLVIENYVRSLNSGTKYLYQTLPRILTLWLDLGAQVDKAPEGKVSLSRELHRRRIEQLGLLHSFLDKYIQRLPAFIFYTALPQIVARIAHPNPAVFDRLTHIIVKVVEAHPRQALWSLIGIMTTRQVSERKARGTQVLQTLRNQARKVEGSTFDMKYLLKMAEKLAEQLLLACQNGDFHSNKTVHASLTKDLRFNHKSTPCPLVVPVESSLTATLPAVSEYLKKHKAFSREVVTIDSFLDDVLVLSSLAKPRRLTARGSDGKSYMLLIKPKDDLRTDQRLMEFNGIINRSLKRDAESSRRQLYIRTYAVTPLNEECGIIEWVPGIKTMRDILNNLYASRKIYPDYTVLRQLMDEASASDSKIRVFTDDVLGRFPPILHLWFTQQFPNPSAWFAARLRYTRSCAVMSMVGTILGLGDRHGENVNLEEGNGGIFHVDFNCLFDKGLTFAKPERVPFRLTHNMVAAMGIYGYEGPFRRSCELTLSILRQQEETLMTILEAFIYDPTLDLQKEKRTQRRGDVGIKLQPQSVVDSIKRKVRGLLPTESIPLGVEGQVEELIKQAVDPRNLTAMYIGWCPFL